MDDFARRAHSKALWLLEVAGLVDELERVERVDGRLCALDTRADLVTEIARLLAELVAAVRLELARRRASGDDVEELGEVLVELEGVEARRAELAHDVEEDLRRRGRQRGAARALS